jgi:hypothetical protein
MKVLPIDARGYPVPWFVAWIDGVPDFRVADGKKMKIAIEQQKCWLCGQPMGRVAAFVIGAMCAINRVSSEPPCHRTCAIFAAMACPFLTRPHAKRRGAGLPEIAEPPPAGVAIMRNPGVALVWLTRTWKWYREGEGVLWDVGEPMEALWFSEGGPATRAEVEESIESGIPLILADIPADTEEGRDARQYFEEQRERAQKFLPPA